MEIYLCTDTVDGIFSAIYQAWEAGTSHTDVRVSQSASLSLFETYIETTTNEDFALRVQRAIREKLSEDVYTSVYYAALSYEAEKASIIYHFLQKAFRRGAAILNQLADPDVLALFQCARTVSREAGDYLGFVRFKELENGILAGCIDPRCHIVPIISEHFADRLHNENWILLDTKREFAAVHYANGQTLFHNSITEDMLSSIPVSTQEDNFHALWNRFFDTIAIEERINPKLQRSLMPLRCRHYM